MDNIDNVGEVVPTLVIKHFLEGVRRGMSLPLDPPRIVLSHHGAL
jgi:hypothetical protein